MAESIRLEGLAPTEGISPGGSRRIVLSVTNAGEIVDQYMLSVTGLDETWYTLEPAAVSLFPGANGRAELTLHPPAGKEGQAGVYPFSVHATSSSDAAIHTTAECELRISTVGKPGVDVRPLRAEGRQATFRVAWKNPSNGPVNIELMARDAEAGLNMFINPIGPVPVPAGEERTVEVTVRPRHRETVGGPHLYELEFLGLKPGTDDLLEPGLKRFAQYTYVPPIRTLSLPRWLRRLPIWALLALLLLLIAVLFFGGRKVGNAIAHSTPATPTRTATASPTVPKPTATLVPTVVPTQVPPPKVGSFGVQVDPKGNAALAWAVQGAKQVTLDGKRVESSGNLAIKVVKPRTYVLSASDEAGTVSRFLEVVPPPIKKLSVTQPAQRLDLPSIRQFAIHADPRSGALTVTWQTQGSDQRTLNDKKIGAKGSAAVPVKGPRRYVLRAMNGAGVTTAILMLPAAPAPRARTVVLNLPSIPLFTLRHPHEGTPYSLVWRTTNAVSATLNGVAVSTSGSQVLHPPLSSKRYILLVRNQSGQVRGQVEVVVK